MARLLQKFVDDAGCQQQKEREYPEALSAQNGVITSEMKARTPSWGSARADEMVSAPTSRKMRFQFTFLTMSLIGVPSLKLRNTRKITANAEIPVLFTALRTPVMLQLPQNARNEHEQHIYAEVDKMKPDRGSAFPYCPERCRPAR